MTQQEASYEACRRWGPNAFAVSCDEETFDVGTLLFPIMSDMKVITYGSGGSWEAAFADADSKTNKLLQSGAC